VATNRMEIITSVERRRRWSLAEKARLVAAMDEPGAVVTEIAREAGVDVSQLYRWRRQLVDERETPAFVPLRVAANVREPDSAMTPIPTPAPSLPPALITIAFGAQVRMTIEGAPDAATLASVIGALTARDRWR
jgi:transposase